MVRALIFLTAGLASAQTGEDARALLQEVASSSRAAKSWFAEGTEVDDLSGLGMQIRGESHFKVAYESPSKMRWETSFYRSPVGVSPCKPDMGDFSNIADHLISAALVGLDHLQFSNASTECELVRAEYTLPTAAAGASDAASTIRTMCIDPARKLILRDRVESSSPAGVVSVQVTTYTRYERDTSFATDLFQFQVPTGYFEDEGPQPDLVVENGVYRKSVQVSAPDVISKVEPAYTEEASRAGVSGIVLVSFQVNSDGSPQEVKVVRGLGHGLDEKAVEAVRQWQFRPGTKDRVPVAVGPLTVAVSFRRQ